MSAVPQSPVRKPVHLCWRCAEVGDIDALLDIEQRAYSHPWTRGNFQDSLTGGHWAWLGWETSELRAYWLAMPVLDELHLLNFAVHPNHWGRGLGQQALHHLEEVAQAQGLNDLWLEVRASNLRAQDLYQRGGFFTVGRRRGYYPLGSKDREDALLMRRRVGAPR